MAYSSAKIDPTSSSFHQFLSHFIYNVGRISAYIILGILFGALGSLFTFSAYVSGYFYFFAGIVMVLMGLSMMGKMKFLTSLESNIAFHPLIKKIFSHLIHTKTLVSFYGLGLLNGFLPCGLVYFFLATAATSGSHCPSTYRPVPCKARKHRLARSWGPRLGPLWGPPTRSHPSQGLSSLFLEQAGWRFGLVGA